MLCLPLGAPAAGVGEGSGTPAHAQGVLARWCLLSPLAHAAALALSLALSVPAFVCASASLPFLPLTPCFGSSAALLVLCWGNGGLGAGARPPPCPGWAAGVLAGDLVWGRGRRPPPALPLAFLTPPKIGPRTASLLHRCRTGGRACEANTFTAEERASPPAQAGGGWAGQQQLGGASWINKGTRKLCTIDGATVSIAAPFWEHDLLTPNTPSRQQVTGLITPKTGPGNVYRRLQDLLLL